MIFVMILVKGRLGYIAWPNAEVQHFDTVDKNHGVGVDIFSRQRIWIKIL